MILRRSFLKGLCASVMLTLSRIFPDLAPERSNDTIRCRVTRWQVRLTDPVSGKEQVIPLPPGAVPIHGHASTVMQRHRDGFTSTLFVTTEQAT